MAGSINQVAVSGNLTRDPELRHTPGGTAVVNLGMANDRNRKDTDGEWIVETSFFDVTVWGKHGEFCARKLKKGSQVFVVGRLEQQQWQDKESGGNRSKVIIVASRVEGPDFFTPGDEVATPPQGQLNEQAEKPAAADDNIPF